MFSLLESEAVVTMRMEQNRRLALSAGSLRRRLRPLPTTPLIAGGRGRVCGYPLGAPGGAR